MRGAGLILAAAALLASAALFPASAAASGRKNPDFSGRWALNLEKSEIETGREGRGGGRIPSRISIEQDANKLVLTRTHRNREGEEVATRFTYTLDGKKSENRTNLGKQVSHARWSADGLELHITSTMEVSRRETRMSVRSEQIWSIENGALVMETTRATPRGEVFTRAVYDRAVE